MKSLLILHISLKYQIIRYVNSATNLIRKPHSVKLTVVHLKFSKILIFTWNQILSLTPNSVSCFLWSDSLTLFIFQNEAAKYPFLNNRSLSVVFQRPCTMKRAVSSAHNSNNHTSAFPQDNHITSKYSKNSSHVLTIFSHRIPRVGIKEINNLLYQGYS